MKKDLGLVSCFRKMLGRTILVVCIIRLALSDTDHDERSQTELYQHPTENFRCIKCFTGKYVTEPCTEALGKSTCESCGTNEYVRDGGATSCAKCTVCSSNTDKKFVWRNCSKDQDTVCYCGPNATYQVDSYCAKCHPPKVVYRSDSDLDGKCDYCKATTFYDTEENVCKPCTKCGPIGTEILCNSTHDSVCITTVLQTTPQTTTPRTDEGGLNGGEIAGIVIGTVVGILLILAIICVVVKGRDWCRDQLKKFRKCISCPSQPKENSINDKTEESADVEDPFIPKPTESDSKSPSSSVVNGESLNSQSRKGNRTESEPEELTSLMSSVGEKKDEEELTSLMSSVGEKKDEVGALPAWVNPMVDLLSNYLGQPEECLTGLEGTPQFQPTVRYEQIHRQCNGNVRTATRYFIVSWVAARRKANYVEEIIKKLRDMGQESLIEEINKDERIFPRSSPRTYPPQSPSDSYYTAYEDTGRILNPRSNSPILNSNNSPSVSSSHVELQRTVSGHNIDTINDAGSEHAYDAEQSIRIKGSEKSKSHKTNIESDRPLHESNGDTQLRIDCSDRDVDNKPMNDTGVFHGNIKNHHNGSTHSGSMDNGTASGHRDSSGPSQSGGISNLLQRNDQGHSPGASGEMVSRGFADLLNDSSAATYALGETKSVVVDTNNKRLGERNPVQCEEDIEQTFVKQPFLL